MELRVDSGIVQNASKFSTAYERSHLRWNCRRVFRRKRAVRPLLREALGGTMESIIVGLIALALFAYLLFAMLYPEKF